MTIERSLRAIAGFFVLLSLTLGWFVHPAWFLFTAFVGANLLQSAFTNWCPMMVILRKAGVGAHAPSASVPPAMSGRRDTLGAQAAVEPRLAERPLSTSSGAAK
jgi:hypothetical protein